MGTNTLDDNLSVFTFFKCTFLLLQQFHFEKFIPGLLLVCRLIHGGQGETEKRGRPLQIGRWLGREGGNLCRSRSPHLPSTTFKVYIEALMEFHRTHHWDNLNNALFFQGHVLRTAPNVGKMGRTCIPRMREEMRSLQLPGPSRRVKPAVTSFQWLPVGSQT